MIHWMERGRRTKTMPQVWSPTRSFPLFGDFFHIYPEHGGRAPWAHFAWNFGDTLKVFFIWNLHECFQKFHYRFHGNIREDYYFLEPLGDLIMTSAKNQAFFCLKTIRSFWKQLSIVMCLKFLHTWGLAKFRFLILKVLKKPALCPG